MDIAKAFEILSQGKIISANSKEHIGLTNFLFMDNLTGECKEAFDLIGFKLIAENGYYYLARKAKLSAIEQQNFITKHREVIIAISFLRQLYPRLDRGGTIQITRTIAEYINTKSENDSIAEKLAYFSWAKNKEDEKLQIEQLFKFLEDRHIIEKESEDNTDKYSILNSISYYLSIVESVEKGDIDA